MKIGPPPGWLRPLWRRWGIVGAAPWPGVIWIADNARPTTLRHELAHQAQWAEHGWRFPALYLLELLRHGYRGNRFEVAARRAEGFDGTG